jgi:hypothetical protein
MKIKILKIIPIIVFVFVFCFGHLCFADDSKVWVPVGGSEHTPDGEPMLRILQSNRGKLDIDMETGGFFVSEQKENRQPYKILQIGKYHGDLEPGYPDLPVLRRYIYIPAGKKVRLQVNPGDPVRFKDYLVYPVQPPQIDSKDASQSEFFIDDSIYRSDRLFPSEKVFIGEMQTIRGHTVALLHICPFEYNPAGRELAVYPEINVEITFEGLPGNIDQRFSSPVFDNFVKGFVLNPGAFSDYTDAQRDNSETGAELLIITAPDFLSAANDLSTHKQGIGISTLVKTTAETGTTNSQIKSYIQNAYDTWSPAPSYVLLLGDAEFIPTNYQTIHPYHGIYTGTDLYYSTVDGTDYTADIFLGRIPVDTLSEAQTVIQKIIDYESNPPALTSFFSNAAVAAYFQDTNYDNFEDRRFVLTSEEVRDFLMTGGYSVERIYVTPSAVNPTNYNNGYYANGEPLPPELLRTNGFAWDGAAADITSAIHSGIFLLMHRDHGGDRNGGNTHTGWGDPQYNETHIAALANGSLLPVVLSVNCMTGWFDGETDAYAARNYESFCELFLTKENGGAVGVFGATRVSYSGYNDFLAEGFIDCVFPDFLTSVPNNSGASSMLGPMLNHGKVAMDILWGVGSITLTEYEIFHVIGDPSLQMWTQKPGTQGTQTVVVTSTPVLGVPVAVSQTDINGSSSGNTYFTRTYSYGTGVTLTAPPTHDVYVFIKWIVDGVDVTANSIQLTMNQYHSVTCVYAPTGDKTLTVQSSPETGVPITVSPPDKNGNANGNTDFTRLYALSTEVTLTAPAVFNTRDFVRWQVDGVDYTNPTIQVTMDDHHTAQAVYSTLPGEIKILVIDLDQNNTSAVHIQNAITANGYDTEYMNSIPQEISPQLYPLTFLCLGIYPYNHVLSGAEGEILKSYLDNGGMLYMESDDTWAFDPMTAVYPYFGIKPVLDGYGDTSDVTGIEGTFTEGLNFTYGGENQYMDRIDVADGVTDAFIIWDNQSPYYHNGAARDTGSYKTIGVSFEFGGIPSQQHNNIMGKYLYFFIPGEPQITVNSPNGGEEWTLGTTQTITWTPIGLSGNVKLVLYQNGTKEGCIAVDIPVTQGSYDWTVGDYDGGTASPGTGYVVRVKSMENTAYYDDSDASFTILDASLTLASPNGGETWPYSTQKTITWTSSGLTGNVKLVLYQNGTKVGSIAVDIPVTQGSYDWTVGNYDGGTASPGTGYVVRIKSMVNTAYYDDSDASFTIAPPPSVTISSPNGGENWTHGTTKTITWTSSGLTGNVKLDLYRNGTDIGCIAVNIPVTQGSYDWTAGNYDGGTASPGTGYAVRVKSMENTAYYDDSDASFIISGLVLTSPNGGENWAHGVQETITWTSCGITGNVKLVLYQNGNNIGGIAFNIPITQGNYTWTTGNLADGTTVSPGTGYSIRVKSMENTAYYDDSNGSFAISSLTLTSPNGGEAWTTGAAKPITWTSCSVPGNVKLVLIKNGSNVGCIAFDIPAAQGSFSWTVGLLENGTWVSPETGYVVRVKSIENTTCYDDSNEGFSISGDPPELVLTSPNGGENWIRGETRNITWISNGISGNVNLILYKDGTLVAPIAENVPITPGSYIWIVGTTLGGNTSPGGGYVVRVISTEKSESYDDSDGSFTISSS